MGAGVAELDVPAKIVLRQFLFYDFKYCTLVLTQCTSQMWHRIILKICRRTRATQLMINANLPKKCKELFKSVRVG